MAVANTHHHVIVRPRIINPCTRYRYTRYNIISKVHDDDDDDDYDDDDNITTTKRTTILPEAKNSGYLYLYIIMYMRVHNTRIYTYTHIYPKDTTVDYVMSLPHARRLCDACIT